MNDILKLRKDDNDAPKTGYTNVMHSEEWVVSVGDKVQVKLVPSDLDTCELNFFYNNEKIGFHVLQDLSSLDIYPFAEVRANGLVVDDTQVYFDLTWSRFKVHFSNLKLRVGKCDKLK
jgi:hypothetical protein